MREHAVLLCMAPPCAASACCATWPVAQRPTAQLTTRCPCLPRPSAPRHLSCTGTCTVPLRGQLGGGLNWLPQLQVLDLAGNQLSGTLPESWGTPGSFPALTQL